MSRQETEKRYSAPSKGKAKARGGIFPFKPSKEQAEDIRDSAYSRKEALADLERKVREGCKLVAGYNEDKDGVYFILRTDYEDFKDNVSVSCWAGSLERSLIGLGYYASSVNPDFPAGVQFSFPQLADW